MCDPDFFHNHVTLTFDLIFLAQLVAPMDYLCTKFGLDSSTVSMDTETYTQTQTHRHTHKVTDANDYPTHGSATSGMSNYHPLVS